MTQYNRRSALPFAHWNEMDSTTIAAISGSCKAGIRFSVFVETCQTDPGMAYAHDQVEFACVLGVPSCRHGISARGIEKCGRECRASPSLKRSAGWLARLGPTDSRGPCMGP